MKKKNWYDEPQLELVIIEETVITTSEWKTNGAINDPDKDEFENMFGQ